MRLLVLVLSLVLSTAAHAQGTCKGAPITVSVSASGSNLDLKANSNAIYRAALNKLNRQWKAIAKARHGADYDKPSANTCSCRRTVTASRITISCTGTARACRTGFFRPIAATDCQKSG